MAANVTRLDQKALAVTYGNPGNSCHHGKTWDEECEHCEYEWDKGTVESFKPKVDAALNRIKAYERKHGAKP